jgi:adsorption protein B
VAQWLQLLERELLFFALFWFIVGMIDEMLVDAVWIGLRCFGGVRTQVLPGNTLPRAAAGRLFTSDAPLAVFIPTWRNRR